LLLAFKFYVIFRIDRHPWQDFCSSPFNHIYRKTGEQLEFHPAYLSQITKQLRGSKP